MEQYSFSITFSLVKKKLSTKCVMKRTYIRKVHNIIVFAVVNHHAYVYYQSVIESQRSSEIFLEHQDKIYNHRKFYDHFLHSIYY
ncbi:hypothetical protein V1478_004373 [Vespula squamosa]|uniref:Uncharacterized protein n=1 Tax=Vespula squamosa TaxID=30214 RepID=A0ABD2BH83_VESSQ